MTCVVAFRYVKLFRQSVRHHAQNSGTHQHSLHKVPGTHASSDWATGTRILTVQPNLLCRSSILECISICHEVLWLIGYFHFRNVMTQQNRDYGVSWVGGEIAVRFRRSIKVWISKGTPISSSGAIQTCANAFDKMPLSWSVAYRGRGVGGSTPHPEIPKFWHSRTGLQIEWNMFSVPIPTS